MEKIDFKKSLKQLYVPPAKNFTVVEVPMMQFLMIDGAGNPNSSQSYARAIEWLYSVSYPAKFMSKKEFEKDYVVPPLEGLWWADDMSAFTSGDKDNWLWTMMIMQPDWITKEIIAAAIEKAGKKLGAPPDSLRLESFEEGLCVQIMHIGAYDAEGPAIAKLHDDFLPENGLVENGHHHEIYISDPRKAAPEKLKTVLRQPVKKMIPGL